MQSTGRTITVFLAAAGLLCAALGPISVIPATVTFQSSDPDAGAVAGTPVTVSWHYTDGWHKSSWSIRVRANSSTLTNCRAIPASAIRVSCQSVTIRGGAPGTGSGACSPPFQLGTVDQQVAGGLQQQHDADYTVNIIFSFQDSWRYQGAVNPACALELTYTVFFE